MKMAYQRLCRKRNVSTEDVSKATKRPGRLWQGHQLDIIPAKRRAAARVMTQYRLAEKAALSL